MAEEVLTSLNVQVLVRVYSSRAGTWDGLFYKADPRNRGATVIGAYGDGFQWSTTATTASLITFPANKRHQQTPSNAIAE
jgi:hypothetical protein